MKRVIKHVYIPPPAPKHTIRSDRKERSLRKRRLKGGAVPTVSLLSWSQSPAASAAPEGSPTSVQFVQKQKVKTPNCSPSPSNASSCTLIADNHKI